MEKKSKILAVSLLVMLLAIAALAYIRQNESLETLNPDLLKMERLGEVTNVTIYSASDTIQLAFKNGKWLVNDKWAADPAMIRVLFATANQLKPRREVKVEPAKNWYVVEYSIDSEVVGRYEIMGNSAKTEAYVKLPEGIYQVIIPGYSVYPAGIFEVGLADWRQKLVFNFNWRNFSVLRARFENPVNNFEVELADGFFKIKDEPKTDTTRLNRFLDGISFLSVERYIPATGRLDSLGKTVPIGEFEIQDIAGRKIQLKVYPSKTDPVPVFINQEDWAQLPAAALREILVPKAYFSTGTKPQ